MTAFEERRVSPPEVRFAFIVDWINKQGWPEHVRLEALRRHNQRCIEDELPPWNTLQWQKWALAYMRETHQS